MIFLVICRLLLIQSCTTVIMVGGFFLMHASLVWDHVPSSPHMTYGTALRNPFGHDALRCAPLGVFPSIPAQYRGPHAISSHLINFGSSLHETYFGKHVRAGFFASTIAFCIPGIQVRVNLLFLFFFGIDSGGHSPVHTGSTRGHDV